MNGQGASFEVASVKALVEARRSGTDFPYDVWADGRRFLIISASDDTTTSGITVAVIDADLTRYCDRCTNHRSSMVASASARSRRSATPNEAAQRLRYVRSASSVTFKMPMTSHH